MRGAARTVAHALLRETVSACGVDFVFFPCSGSVGLLRIIMMILHARIQGIYTVLVR
jgi:hypothetical protein